MGEPDCCLLRSLAHRDALGLGSKTVLGHALLTALGLLLIMLGFWGGTSAQSLMMPSSPGAHRIGHHARRYGLALYPELLFVREEGGFMFLEYP